jgi:hypothetical protein
MATSVPLAIETISSNIMTVYQLSERNRCLNALISLARTQCYCYLTLYNPLFPAVSCRPASQWWFSRNAD